MPEPTAFSLRLKILKQHGLVPHKRKHKPYEPEPYDESTVDIPKSPLMKYIEEKYDIKLKIDIYKGSITDIVIRYNWEVDRATVSRWRKHIRRFLIK